MESNLCVWAVINSFQPKLDLVFINNLSTWEFSFPVINVTSKEHKSHILNNMWHQFMKENAIHVNTVITKLQQGAISTGIYWNIMIEKLITTFLKCIFSFLFYSAFYYGYFPSAFAISYKVHDSNVMIQYQLLYFI